MLIVYHHAAIGARPQCPLAYHPNSPP